MLLDILKARRSIRKFEDREVEKEKINILLKGALLAPSSRARRPWEYIVVTDKEMLKELSKSREHGSQFLAGAPLAIVVIADPDICDVWIEDASITSIIIQLSAQDLGLGSCWIQARERFYSENVKTGEYIKKVLGIPEKYSVECMIAVGYPAEGKKPYNEDELLYNKIHLNRF